LTHEPLEIVLYEPREGCAKPPSHTQRRRVREEPPSRKELASAVTERCFELSQPLLKLNFEDGAQPPP
jgi:hypothetical protein